MNRLSYDTRTKIAAAGRTAVAPATLEQSAKDYRELLTALSTKRQIMKGGRSESMIFQVVDGKVLVAAFQMKQHDVFYTWNNGEVEQAAPEINLSLNIATEEQLIAARAMVPAAQAGQIDILLKIVRDGETPPAPLRVEIVNPDKIGADRVLTIKRTDDGKMAAVVSQTIT
jgi:hypothetical protein